VVIDDDGRIFDLTGVTNDIDGAFLSTEPVERVRAAHAAGDLPELAGASGTTAAAQDADEAGLDARFGAPVARPGKIVCVGLNYSDHAAETNTPPPAEPVVFFKASNTLVGPTDTVLIPRLSVKTDYEVELAIVIGKTARYLASPADASAVIAGFAVANDVSEREFQIERGGQWDKGKSCETFNPLGPWLVPAAEISDPQALGLRLWVNGELRQNGNTSNMIFGINHIIWYLSQFMVLEPGDLINTGTPAGVGLGANDFAYLREGDVVELEIDQLGRQRQVMGQA